MGWRLWPGSTVNRRGDYLGCAGGDVHRVLNPDSPLRQPRLRPGPTDGAVELRATSRIAKQRRNEVDPGLDREHVAGLEREVRPLELTPRTLGWLPPRERARGVANAKAHQ